MLSGEMWYNEKSAAGDWVDKMRDYEWDDWLKLIIGLLVLPFFIYGFGLMLTGALIAVFGVLLPVCWLLQRIGLFPDDAEERKDRQRRYGHFPTAEEDRAWDGTYTPEQLERRNLHLENIRRHNDGEKGNAV